MKKQFLAILATSVSLMAGSNLMHQGSNELGIGFNVDYRWDWGNNYGGVVAWDHGAFNDMLSLGAGLDFSTGDRWSYLTPSFRLGFHPLGIPGINNTKVGRVLDPYIVSSWGFDIGIWDGYSNTTDFYWGINPGIRWNFTPVFGLWAEGGWHHGVFGINLNF